MTDREILERATRLLGERGSIAAAESCRRVAGLLLPDPPADCVEVRIAVAVGDGGVGLCWVDSDDVEDELAIEEARDEIDPIATIAEAIVVARIPRRTVPVIEGEVKG